MGKNKNSPRNQSQDLYKYEQQQRDENAGRYNPAISDAQTRANQSYTGAAGAYNTALGQLPAINAAAESLMSGGGIDPADRANVERSIADFRGLPTGEAGKLYSDFIKTGGYTPEELANTRAAGNRVLPSFFAALKRQLGTAGAATGGFGPGYSGQMAKMARDQAHGSQEAALDTENAIANAVHSGKLSGASGLAGLQEAAAEGSGRLGLGLAGMGQQGRLAGAGLLSDAGRLALGAGEGYAGLRSQAPGEVGMYENLGLNRESMYNDQMERNLEARDKMKKGWNWGSALKGAGKGVLGGVVGGPAGMVVGGLAGGVAGGLSG
jgi:hypothetical protein